VRPGAGRPAGKSAHTSPPSPRAPARGSRPEIKGYAGWDPELLRLELGELKLGGFDLSLTGFGDLELKDLSAAWSGSAGG